MIRRLEDRGLIRRFCGGDPLRFVFHLGDLDDAEWARSRYLGLEREGRLEEIALVYLGLSLPSVQLFGRRGPLGAAAAAFLPELPDAFHLHCQEEDLSRLASGLVLGESGELFRMRWTGFPAGLGPPAAPARPLSRADLPALLALLREAFPAAFFEPSQLEKAPFAGCFEGGRLAACAGFHVLSAAEGVGVLGSVATRPESRGKGLAASATRRLLEELRGSVRLVALNVHVDNGPALALYRRLGFEPRFRYRETAARRVLRS